MSEEFVLSADNYYSAEANSKYMSVHQYLEFAGGFLLKGCEERAMAELDGTWCGTCNKEIIPGEEHKCETPKPLLVGSYVDSYFEGTLEQFKKEHKEIFTKDGKTLKAEFKQAETMIKRCERDETFMRYMSGEKQKIFTGYLFGCEWKVKLDSYIPDVAIIDLKTSADIRKMWKIADYGYASFVEAFNYTTQLAVYQKIVEINTGKKLPCYIAAVSKSDEPDIEIIYIDQQTLDNALNTVEMNMASVLAVKNREIEPIRCGKCKYCLHTKKLSGPISMYDLIEE